MTVKNFGLVLLAGGAAIAGLGFFMRSDEDEPDTEANVTQIDQGKARIAGESRERPGNLNVIDPVRIRAVTAIYE
ncbi:hypothetical protein CMI37_08870 [Candidatus Pacearchaeota archaeon]|jgi:hypothetical protein|nr:hypothetical protein [Candidatus Pacearchaeota archaeon]